MRPVGEALPRLVVVVNGVAVGNDLEAGLLQRALVEAAGEAVLGHGGVLLPAQRQVGKATCRDAAVAAPPVAAKVLVAPELRLGELANVGRLVPVRHAPRVAALVLDHALVGRHVVSVKGQESTLFEMSKVSAPISPFSLISE